MADKMQFVILLIAAITEVFACAWPADHLMDMVSYVSRQHKLPKDVFKMIKKHLISFRRLKHSRSLCCLGY